MKDSTNINSLNQIIQAIDISPQRTVLLYGKPYGGEFANPYTQQASNKMLFQSLETVIYTVFFSKNKQMPEAQLKYPDYNETQKFMESLSLANNFYEYFDEGWTIEQVDMQGQITAQKGNLKRLAYAGEFVNAGGFNQKPVEHTAVRMIVRKEHKDVNGGFYYVFGTTLGEDNYDQYARIYFHIQPAGAAVLINKITTVFNEWLLPFNFKCLNNPNLYTRCDASVLYFEKRYSDSIFYLLPEIYQSVKKHLNEEIPLFTKKLGKGIAFCENPIKQEESFGTHCCKMIGQGIMQAFQKNINKQSWVEEIKNNILQNHHYPDIEKLYLNPGSNYPYSFPALS